MRLSDDSIEPVRKTRTVPLDPVEAFDLFTTRMGAWWPLASHSIAEHNATGIRFEERIGGRVIELTEDGTGHSWADVIAWDPPHRSVVAWHPSVQPDAATILEVRFNPGPDGGTRLELEHRGWEEFGDERGNAARTGYQSGWSIVLEPFETASSAATGVPGRRHDDAVEPSEDLLEQRLPAPPAPRRITTHTEHP